MEKGSLEEWVLARTGARAVGRSEVLQTLWGGYGELLRLHLEGAPSVILKRVSPPARASGVSDERKRRSYEVEWNWYCGPARQCGESCRVAACLAAEGPWLLLEDLGHAGFQPGRPPRLEAGLRWLAGFHATYLGQSPPGLWEQGSYWHLATRREEWRAMPAGPLREQAEALDRRLRAARHQTLLHGDCKPANFLWKGDLAAAVDFQYVGPGCGIRDVAYFLDCCTNESGCEEWLDFYFAALREALGGGIEELEAEWRTLFPVAWTDFWRFYQGWGGPSHLGPFSQRQLARALEILEQPLDDPG